MKNKVLVELLVPEIDESFDIYIPINKKIGNIIELLNKALGELTDGSYIGSQNNFLYNVYTKERYQVNHLVVDTDIRNGTRLVLM